MTSLCFSPSGRYLVSCSDIGERAIRVWFGGMPLYDRDPAPFGLRLRWARTGLIKRLRASSEPSAMAFFLNRQEDREIRESSDESAGEKVGGLGGGGGYCVFYTLILISFVFSTIGRSSRLKEEKGGRRSGTGKSCTVLAGLIDGPRRLSAPQRAQ